MQVAQAHYVGQVSIPHEATTLEQALGLEGREHIATARVRRAPAEQLEAVREVTLPEVFARLRDLMERKPG